MATSEDIGWSSYDVYEGPFYLGTQKFVMPSNPSEGMKILRVITATEGGHWDAYNGYDVCICTSGLIQWCDRAPFFLVCKLLGTVAESGNETALKQLRDYAAGLDYTFENVGGWRWVWKNGVVVSSESQQRQMYCGGCNGRKKQWTDEQKLIGKGWAAAVSSVWEDGDAKLTQASFTVERLDGFITGSTRSILEVARTAATNVSLAFRAAYLSYAANNPTRAANALAAAVAEKPVSWTEEWLTIALRHMAFDSGVAIYPARYNSIRPQLEALYGVNLPPNASALRGEATSYIEPIELQRALVALGYDIGPVGADGSFGNYTKRALIAFERDNSCPVQDGTLDATSLKALENALEKNGTALLWAKD